MNGLAQRLDTSFRQAASSDYTDWTLGLVMDVPIGNKTALSQRQIAELDMARVHIRLNAQELNVAFQITELISDLRVQWQRLEISKRQAAETQEWLRVSKLRYSDPDGSNIGQDWLLLALTDLQSAMRASVDSVSQVGEALAEYNTLLARLQQTQGISVYQWRQQAPRETFGGSVGGHAGFVYQDYRANPEQVLQTFSASRDSTREVDIPPLSHGPQAPANGKLGGHVFLQESAPVNSRSSDDSSTGASSEQ